MGDKILRFWVEQIIVWNPRFRSYVPRHLHDLTKDMAKFFEVSHLIKLNFCVPRISRVEVNSGQEEDGFYRLLETNSRVCLPTY